jgi:hypothetical protein
LNDGVRAFYVNGRDISNLGICHPGLMTFDEQGQPNDKPTMIWSTNTCHRGRTAVGFFDSHAEARLITPKDLPVKLLNPYQQ